MYIIVLTGMPASGKSTTAKYISHRLHLPLIEKDHLKEVLFDTIGFENYRQKRTLDYAANALLLEICENMIKSNIPVILDNNFDSSSTEKLNAIIKENNCKCISIVFQGDIDAVYSRYVERDLKHERHLGHILQEHYPPHDCDSLDYTMTRSEFEEKFVKRGMSEFKCDCIKIEVDSTNLDNFKPDAVLGLIQKYITK